MTGGAFTEKQQNEINALITQFGPTNTKAQTKLKVMKALKEKGYNPNTFSVADYDYIMKTIDDYYLVVGKGATGGVRPTEKQFLDIVKTSYSTAPPKLVSDFELVYATPTVDAWVNEPRKTIVVSVRGTDITDKQDIVADASLVANALKRTPRYQKDRASILEVFGRYDPSQMSITS
jgi:hypothetical protein